MTGIAATLLIAITAASGLVLVAKGGARTSGVLLTLGALLGAAALAIRVLDGPSDLRRLLIVATTYVVLPAAVLVYPTWVWRRPVDFIISTTVIASGALSVAYFRDPAITDAMGLVLGLAVAVHLWWRIETTAGDTRIALQWLAVTLGFFGLLFGLVSFAAEGASGNGTTAGIVLLLVCLPIAPSMVVGVLRPHVFDVRGVVVWGAVTVRHSDRLPLRLRRHRVGPRVPRR